MGWTGTMDRSNSDSDAHNIITERYPYFYITITLGIQPNTMHCSSLSAFPLHTLNTDTHPNHLLLPHHPNHLLLPHHLPYLPHLPQPAKCIPQLPSKFAHLLSEILLYHLIQIYHQPFKDQHHHQHHYSCCAQDQGSK